MMAMQTQFLAQTLGAAFQMSSILGAMGRGGGFRGGKRGGRGHRQM